MQKLLWVAIVSTLAANAIAAPIALIDTHAHFQSGKTRAFKSALRTALSNMDAMNIARTILMPPPQPDPTRRSAFDIEDLQFVLKENPGRFAIIGGSSLNAMIHGTAPDQVTDAVKDRFNTRAREIIQLGAVGFGEIAVLHVSIPAMGAQHPYEAVQADHPLLLQLADIAAELDVPIDLHCDLVPEAMPLPQGLRPNRNNPDSLTENRAGLERLFAYNPKARFVWAHVGFEPLMTRNIGIVRDMLQAHPNLYMSFRLNRGAPRPAAAINADGQPKPPWLNLVKNFPDRFVLGSDAFYDSSSIARGSTAEGFENLRRFIEQLPPEVAKSVANGNAMRIYRLEIPARR